MKRNQLLVFGGLFVAVTAVLSVVYLLMFQQDYVVLYDNIREQDSAAIIAELESEGIEFELAGNGTRVMVPEGEADRARVVVAGAGIPMGGVVGFELFNETDMGLTDFAQKVNYQRALQGELARTIMMMDGVAFARVHLSLPERTLFRANSPQPKAAVTVQAKHGRRVSDDRVSGIQQLVSSSVTGLAAGDVAVLDENGELVSVLVPDTQVTNEALNEKSALEEYYRARATKAAMQVSPGLNFQIRVNALDRTGTEETNEEGTGSGKRGERNFDLHIAFRTEFAIAESDQSDLRKAIENAVDLKRANGDMLRFEVAAFEPVSDTAPVRTSGTEDYGASGPSAAADQSAEPAWDYLGFLGSRWFWLAMLVLLVVTLSILRQRSRLSKEEQQSFAEVLGEQLVSMQETRRG